MGVVFGIFEQNILPILLVAGFGFILRRKTQVDKQTLTRLTFYIFSPALLFSSLVSSPLPLIELTQIGGFAVAQNVVMGLVGLVFGRIFQFNRKQTIILIAAAMFSNNGNYGLALNELRYGADGLSAAIPYYVVEGIFLWTVGVIIFSLGSKSWREALIGLLRLPTLYAVIGAIVVKFSGLTIPAALESSITIAGRGAIPVMLIILGMQIADINRIDSVKIALPAIAMRLLIAPIVAYLLLRLFGMSGLNYNVSLLQASMPVAVASIVLATEYDLMPKAMTTTVVLTTLISPFALVTLIQLFGL